MPTLLSSGAYLQRYLCLRDSGVPCSFGAVTG